MKKLLVFILSICLHTSVSAQKVYFIYLESASGLPFYVRSTDKIYSSASSGYLIMPNLVDSTYTFFIGFPSAQQKETKFIINISNTDRGFEIKQSGEEVNLLDIQSLATVRSAQEQANTNVTYKERSDAFTSLLSRAANDSSLLWVPIFAKAEPKASEKENEKPKTDAPMKSEKTGTYDIASNPEVTKPVTENSDFIGDTILKQTDTTYTSLQQQSVAGVKEQTGATTVDDKAIVKDSDSGSEQLQTNHSSVADVTDSAGATGILSVNEYQRSIVKKHSESSTSEGFGLVFFDANGETVDTIRLLIPNPKIQFSDVAEQQNKTEIKSPDTVQVTAAPKENTGGSNAASMNMQPEKNETVAIGPKSKCSTQATDNDFFKLRRDMAARETDEAMVEEAKKYFKTKCYTTEQVKNLSALFLTSAGKYLFFDAAFLHVYDQDRFASLQSEIKDDYYLRRFKALIGE